MRKIFGLALTLLALGPVSAHSAFWTRATPDGMDVNSDKAHEVTVLHDGAAALVARIDLIGRAQSSIMITTHTFDPDGAGRLVLQALVSKARQMRRDHRPFTASIIVDGWGFGGPGLDLAWMHALAAEQIELRYFHPVRVIVRPEGVQPNSGDPIHDAIHGTHRKLFIKDDDEFIIGGRNLGDKYYEIAGDRNALDRDLLIKGPIAAKVRESFLEFWNSPWTSQDRTNGDDLEKLKALKMTMADGLKGKPRATTPEPAPAVDTTDWDRRNWGEIERIGRAELASHAPKFTVGWIKFVSDGPSGDADKRRVTPMINSYFAGTKVSLYGEQLYFQPLRDRVSIFKTLSAAKIDMKIFTNSNQSNPDPIAGLNYLFVDKLASVSGAEGQAWFHRGTAPERTVPSWGTHNYQIHTKGWVRDHSDTWVGSYNLDSVSAEHNAEAAVVIPGNPDLARAVETDMEWRWTNDAEQFRDVNTDELSPYHGLSWGQRWGKWFELRGMMSGPVIHEM